MAEALRREPRTLAAVNMLALLGAAEYWAYRLAGYFLLNLVDDPAWLALIFC